ncbi:MAG: RluA family pseudouridine synthase [Ktedonobacteraceae bacterium]
MKELQFLEEIQLYDVQEEQIGQRLDRFLTPILAHLSRTNIQQLIADETVLVKGKVSKAGYALRRGDIITIVRSTPVIPPTTATAHEIPLDILYEDEDLLVLNKAPGMVVHPAPGHRDDTLVNALLARYPELQGVGEEGRPGIVHRLDKDTSGLIIIARNGRTLTALMEQMQRHEIVKRYLALVEGDIAHDQGSIDAPIGRDIRNRQQMTITTRDSREARTHFRVLQRFARHTLLLLQLETGRTHQIRVHLKAIGHPVVGDPVYGSGNAPRGFTLRRQFLHAYQLQFDHPITGKLIEIEAPLPKDLQNILDRETVL